MSWPLVDAWRSRRRGVDRPTWGLLVGLGWLWVMPAVVAASPEWWLSRNHHQGSFAVWAVTQTVPFMYTLETRWTALREAPPVESAPVTQCEQFGMEGWRQHVPLAQITNPQRRPMYRFCGLPATVVLESRLRGYGITSRWRMEARDGVVVITEAE